MKTVLNMWTSWPVWEPIIKVEGNTAIIDGTEKLTGARISAPDLRAGAALVIAGLAGEGITVVDDIVYIQRGYEDFDREAPRSGRGDREGFQ